jgi:hypothetical protein
MINLEARLNELGVKLTEQLVNDIQTKLIQRRGANGTFESVVNASGKLAKSIRFEVTNGTVLSIYGNDYIQYLQNGRGPTKNGGNGAVKRAIRQWIDDKGIIPDGISKDSLAFLIARRIHQEGSTIYQAGGSDLISGIFNEALQRSIEAEFAQLLVTEIQSEIFDLLAA